MICLRHRSRSFLKARMKAQEHPNWLQRLIALPKLNLTSLGPPSHQQPTHLYLKATNQRDDLSPGALTAEGPPHTVTASLGHVLTNAIILQEFILEVMAVVQLRAGLF